MIKNEFKHHEYTGCRGHHSGKRGSRLFSLIPKLHRHDRHGGFQEEGVDGSDDRNSILMVGSPNVGKSALFNQLTGTYATVSNYPGTTVALAVGRMKLAGREYEVVDTPGMYTLLSITDEERVTRKILLEGGYDVILHVIDAKNLGRMLTFTLQLIEAGLPVILVLNIMDEAIGAGLDIDTETLSRRLGIPVVPTISISGKGVKELKKEIARYTHNGMTLQVDYGVVIERAVRELAELMPAAALTSRSEALLVLQEDRDMLGVVTSLQSDKAQEVFELVNSLKRKLENPVNYYLAMGRQRRSEQLLGGIIKRRDITAKNIREKIDKLLISPLTGVPILVLVLYFGFYKFVGVFGAGTVVDFLEGHLFETYLTPFINDMTRKVIPWTVLQDLIAFDYGILTLGVRYAVAIVLPIVGAFFLVFSVVEDSGYLPRLSLLIDRIFKKIGLSGRAVIPMTLGFGCGTMATMVTRTLESKRERMIATVLLALAIPCSAQLGVIFALTAQKPGVLVTWIGVTLFIFLLIGYLTARLLPGEEPQFFMELPPLRMPTLANIWVKTATRMQWYFREILPLFLLASVIIWAGKLTGLFDLALWLLEFPTKAIGLPAEAAQALLYGFFRRDYGAAGLYDLQQGGLLTGNELAVAAITLTLFLPCIAQFLVMMKERGKKTAIVIAAFVFPFAFLVGGIVHFLLRSLGINLQ